MTASSEPPKSTPWAAFARGVRDNLIGEVGGQAIRVGGVVVLARLLTTNDFGVFRILMVLGMFVTEFCEAGIPDALVQRKDLESSHEATGWWLTVGLAGLSVTLLYFIAPQCETLMAMPGLAFGLRLICVPCFLEGLAIIASARLRRRLKFSPIALSEVFAEIGFVIAAILLIRLGYPRWSLSGGFAVRLSVHAVTILLAEPYFPRELPRLKAAEDLRQFASSVFGGRMIAIASGNIDYVMVGRLLGSSALGFYSTAWDLLRFVPGRLHRIAGRVVLPAFAKIQDDNEALSDGYQRFVDYIARFVLTGGGVRRDCRTGNIVEPLRRKVAAGGDADAHFERRAGAPRPQDRSRGGILCQELSVPGHLHDEWQIYFAGRHHFPDVSARPDGSVDWG